MSKYSEFGLAFSREFLLQRGANPVLYLTTDGLITGSGRFNGDEYTDGVRHALKYLADRLRGEERDEGGFALHSFLTLQVFPLIKPFRGVLRMTTTRTTTWSVSGGTMESLGLS